MTFFIFPHDEGTPISVDHVRAWLRKQADVVSIHESNDRFAALRWTVNRDGSTFECTLAVNGTAVSADYDVEPACHHLSELASTCPVPMDLCDEEYSAHIHLHDRSGLETPWSELVKLWSAVEGGG